MEDTYSQFLILVGDICAGAAMAGLWVEVRTSAGVGLVGTPASIAASNSGEQVDETGYEQTVYIGDGTVNLDEIVECTIRAPGNGGGHSAGLARRDQAGLIGERD